MSTRLRFIFNAVVGIALTSSASWAETLRVPSQYPTIQEAIFAARPGDTVLVADGVYTGLFNKNIDFGGMAITVRSENGPQACIIDCELDGRGFRFRFGEGRDSILDGFSVINGSVSNFGGAVYLSDFSSPTIRNCVFELNESLESGGAVACQENSNPMIFTCVMRQNTVADFGGGLYANFSSPDLIDCLFQSNSARHGGAFSVTDSSMVPAGCMLESNSASDSGGGGSVRNGSNVVLSRSQFIRNTSGSGGNTGAGALYNATSNATVTTIRNCVFVDNQGRAGGGIQILVSSVVNIVGCTFLHNDAVIGGAIRARDSSTIQLTDSVLWSDTASQAGPEISVGQSATLNVSFSDVFGGFALVHIEPNATFNWLEGNIVADPQFVGPTDFHLTAGSPCINVGDPAFRPQPGETDIDGELRVWNGRVDMGADEFGSTALGFIGAGPSAPPLSIQRISWP